MTLPAEAAGAAPGRGRLTGRRVLVVGAGTRSSPEPDPPLGNGRAISVVAAREGAAVACATVWLLSGESSYVNAHPLILDGGATSFG